MPRLLLGIHLLLLVLVQNVQAQGEVVFSIENKAVTRAEFEYYYSRIKNISVSEYLPRLVDFKLQVVEAEHQGIDTLFAFRNQLVYYESKLDELNKNRRAALHKAAYELYLRKQQRLHVKEWVRVAHITRYLPQHVDPDFERKARVQMDSIYQALKNGADFERLAACYSEDEATKMQGGLLPWIPVHYQVQEWIEHLNKLKQGEVSVPFYSPLGIHLIKWVEKKDNITFEEKERALMDYLECEKKFSFSSEDESQSLAKKEIREGLMVACLHRQGDSTLHKTSEIELEAYYRKNKKKYRWELPHFKGAVIHCKDKRSARIIKKYLKKKDICHWQDAIQKLNNGASSKVKIEVGVFAIAENKYVDKLVFKCGDFDPLAAFPYTFVLGKKLKKGPDSYLDVYDLVLKDYQNEYKKTLIESLREKYRVEIYPDVLKTVNYNGSK